MMATQIAVPKLAVSVTEGTIVSWSVADGEAVKAGQALYLLETEKVETEMESPIDGTIRLIGEAGETYPVGTVIAEIT